MSNSVNTGVDNFDVLKKITSRIEGWLADDEGKFLYYAAWNCTGK